MTASDNGPVADAWDELRERAQHLLERLEQGDVAAAHAMVDELNEVRDRTIYREVGKLTRGLHEAITNFDIDVAHVGIDGEHESRIANAQERLDYVINLTQKAADKTMDMVEAGIPVVEDLGANARELRKDWQRLIRREMAPAEFRELYHRIDDYLGHVDSCAGSLGEKFNNILLAQDYQDLSGQVIKKVISLVQEVEERLVHLMRMAGQVEELAGIVRGDNVRPKPERDSRAEGPQIHAAQRRDVVANQDDVDDLLSSLGF